MNEQESIRNDTLLYIERLKDTDKAEGNIFIAYLYDESRSPIGMQYLTDYIAEGTFYAYYYDTYRFRNKSRCREVAVQQNIPCCKMDWQNKNKS